MTRLLLPLGVVALVVGAAGPSGAQVLAMTYVCDRGVTVPAAYLNAGDTSYAVIHVEGRQIALQQSPSASGVRYASPSDGAGYIWWTKGPMATLYWHEGAGDTELLTCRQQ